MKNTEIYAVYDSEKIENISDIYYILFTREVETKSLYGYFVIHKDRVDNVNHLIWEWNNWNGLEFTQSGGWFRETIDLIKADFSAYSEYLLWSRDGESNCVVSEKKCTCDIFALMRNGCQCGGK